MPPLTVHHEPGLLPLELWHGLSERATLFELRDDKPHYFAALRRFLIDLHHGIARTAEGGDSSPLAEAASFTHLVCCGGDATHPALHEAMSDLPFSVSFDLNERYAGLAGALSLFPARGIRSGIALDLGQSCLKVMTAQCSESLPRDEKLLPFGAHVLPPATGRERLRTYLRTGLHRGRLLLEQDCDGLILALPVAITTSAEAAPSTYPGLFGPLEPLLGDLFDGPMVVLNDAVLAALGHRPLQCRKTLVITLGFGVGGALWHG